MFPEIKTYLILTDIRGGMLWLRDIKNYKSIKVFVAMQKTMLYIKFIQKYGDFFHRYDIIL